MSNVREMTFSPLRQGKDERKTYATRVEPAGSAPTSPTIKAYDVTGGIYEEVTTTVFPSGLPSASGNVITWPELRNLLQDHEYRIELMYLLNGDTDEPYCRVFCDR